MFCPPSPQNWSQTFTVWIQDIQVQFQPQVVCRAIRGGFLREVRAVSKYPSALVAMLFCLHCTRPHTGVPRPAPRAASAPGSPAAERHPHVETGLASWYGLGDGFDDRQTASGERFDGNLMTCAHRTLPFGTLVEVDNLENGAHALVRVNDRGPFARGRILDLSPRAAHMLGISSRGVVEVVIRSAQPEGRPVMPEPHPLVPRPAGFQQRTFSGADTLENLVRSLSGPTGAGLGEAVRPGGRAGILAGSFHGVSDARRRADDIARHYKDSNHGLLPFTYREP